jgi:hypothetical protein
MLTSDIRNSPAGPTLFYAGQSREEATTPPGERYGPEREARCGTSIPQFD